MISKVSSRPASSRPEMAMSMNEIMAPDIHIAERTGADMIILLEPTRSGSGRTGQSSRLSKSTNSYSHSIVPGGFDVTS